jgi:hypothetical protein
MWQSLHCSSLLHGTHWLCRALAVSQPVDVEGVPLFGVCTSACMQMG